MAKIQSSNCSSNQVSELDTLLMAARQQYRSDCQQTLLLAEQALRIAQQQHDAAALAQATLLLGQAHYILSGAETALPILRKALTQAKAIAAHRLAAESLIGIACALQSLGQLHAAFLANLDALQAAILDNALTLYAEAYLGMGNLYVQHNEHSKALHYLALASEWADLSADQDLRCKTRLHLSATLLSLREFSLAYDVLQQAKTFLILPLRRDWQAEIFNYLGLIHVEQGESSLALDCLQMACQINAEAGFVWGQTVNLLGLGKLSFRLDQPQAALSYLQQALALVDEFQDLYLLQQIHYQLYLIYEAQGDAVRAMMHHIAYHDHFMKLQRQKEYSQFRANDKRRLQNVEMKLKLLSSELEVNQLKQQRHQEVDRLRELESAVYHDGLTGVYNRRALDERLPELLRLTQESQGNLLAIMIDFDHFKQINDHFSHHIGDVVLRTACDVLSKLSRDNDMLARYGGEEFVLIVHHIDIAIASHIAERMRQKIEQFNWADLQTGLCVSISLGCAVWQYGESAEQLLARADKALYAAKHGGRNCVRFAEVDHA
ncbi:GGDEF domain-containing protein [Deefgea piscis]|uniref:GGDEF domain-containing protein n=1 Tax=Deefgea piscis TaxID=2739061 RepID=UPI001C8271EC|nr:GGDEF domain-containing protein [Deefgea piscis]QZA81332.1 GGDEF domain-containing protein [Deefgea piscis]